MATFTASEASPQPRNMPSGVIAKVADFRTTTQTATASSVFLLAKIPNGATILEVMFFVESGGLNNTWDVGYQVQDSSSTWSVTQSAFISTVSDSNSVVARINVGNGVNRIITVPDTALTPYAWITAVNAVAISASVVMKAVITYTMDGA